MNAYFFKMTKEEKSNILDQHKSLYDGYVTKYNQESNQYPLYVQDYANDKNGVTVSNKGNVKQYTNININESPLDRIGDGPYDLKNGTVDIDSYMDTEDRNTQFMHDVYPSPNEEEFDYESFGKYADDMKQNEEQYEYDIDQLEDYSSEEINETFDDDFEDSEQDDPFIEMGEEFEEVDNEEIISNVDEEDLPEFYSQLQESLDMFKRFKKYN
jgi:hypothetical protein